MISFPVLLVFLGVLALIYYLKSRDDEPEGTKKLPGPKPLPFIGNAHQMQKQMWILTSKWAKEFGDIYKVNLGTMQSVVVSDPKMLKELFLNDNNYVGRMRSTVSELYEGEQLGIVNSEGEMWEVHRRFLLRQLRDFGFGKAAMENLIMEEVNEMIENFKKAKGQPISNIKQTMTIAVINSLWTVVSQKRFKHDDPALLRLIDTLMKLVDDLVSRGGVIFIFPWLRHIIPEWSGYNFARKIIEDNRTWFEGQVEEHKKTFQDDNLRDFIDVHLAEQKKTTDPNSMFYGTIAEHQLVHTLSDLFFAGTDTTSTTLSWAFMYLTKFPEVQKKLQEEIKMVTNNSRHVSVADRPNMPYTQAVFDEILRCSSIVPTGVPHRATEGKAFQGYWIPKGSLIVPNMFYIHHNPKYFEDPEEFKPERFLSEDRKKYKKNENLIPFQIGKRQCAGETLARDTIFLFVANIFQRFDVKFDGEEPPMKADESSIMVIPMPYKLIMKERLE